MINAPSRTAEALRKHVGVEYDVLRQIYDNLDELKAIAANLTPVANLEDFRAKIQAVYANLELLTAASTLISNATSQGINLLTASSIAEQRTHLMLGTAASENVAFFATTGALNALAATVTAGDAAVTALVQGWLGDYAPTAVVNGQIGTLTTDLNAVEALLTSLDAYVTSQVNALTGAMTTAQNRLNGHDTDLGILTANLAAANAVISGMSASIAANGSAIFDLQTTMTGVNGEITSLSSAVLAVEADLTTLDGLVTGHSSAINILQADVTATENGINVLTSNVSSVVSQANTDRAAATLALTTQIDTVNNILNARYTLVLDVNGYISGFKSENTGTVASFTILADNFKIITPGQTAKQLFSVSADGVHVEEDLNINNARIVARAGGFMLVHGVGFGTTNQFIEWFGPEMNIALCSETNAISYKKINGAAYNGGIDNNPPSAGSAVILLAPGDWVGGDGLSPVTMKFSMANNGVLSVIENGSLTPYRPADNWMTPPSVGNAALYECRVIATIGTFSASSAAENTWLSLDTTREWNVNKTSTAGGVSKSTTFTVEVRKISVPGTILQTATMKMTAYYDGTGGEPPVECVLVNSWLVDDIRAESIKTGDTMKLVEPENLNELAGEVEESHKSLQPCVRIVTVSGISLCCSLSAPIPTHGGYCHAGRLHKGVVIPVNDHGMIGWEAVAEVTEIGVQLVQAISVRDQCFWAGEQRGRFIMHHNIAFKPL